MAQVDVEPIHAHRRVRHEKLGDAGLFGRASGASELLSCIRRGVSRQSRMLPFLKIAGFLLAVYLGVVALAAVFQDKLLFPRWAVGPGSPLPDTAERLALNLGSGARLVGVHLPAREQSGGTANLILGFGGNGWNADDLAVHLHTVFPGRDIAAFHYRGYPPSTGRPGTRAMLDDALAIHDAVIARLAPEGVVAVGVSLGAGPAAHLARMRPVAGLILVTPFDTLTALAREHYPWLPVGLLLRHRLDIARDLRSVTAPVAVIAAAQDRIVPARRTDPVRKAVETLVLDRVVAGAGHNDIYARAPYRRAMQEALARIETR